MLLETARFDEENRQSLLFTGPVWVLEARRLAEMSELFRGGGGSGGEVFCRQDMWGTSVGITLKGSPRM